MSRYKPGTVGHFMEELRRDDPEVFRAILESQARAAAITLGIDPGLLVERIHPKGGGCL